MKSNKIVFQGRRRACPFALNGYAAALYMLFMDSKMRRNMIKYKSVFFCGEQENNGKIKVEVMTMNKKVIGMILLTG